MILCGCGHFTGFIQYVKKYCRLNANFKSLNDVPKMLTNQVTLRVDIRSKSVYTICLYLINYMCLQIKFTLKTGRNLFMLCWDNLNRVSLLLLMVLSSPQIALTVFA